MEANIRSTAKANANANVSTSANTSNNMNANMGMNANANMNMATDQTANSMDRCRMGCGTLPGLCAPLVFPYIPMQENNPPRYSNNDAMRAGTLFPELNLPFHEELESRFPAENTALSELMALDFAIDEIGLYLTTHPKDSEVLDLYWSYIRLGRQGRERYEEQYGPLMQTAITPGSFKWLNDPWPWDIGGNV